MTFADPDDDPVGPTLYFAPSGPAWDEAIQGVEDMIGRNQERREAARPAKQPPAAPPVGTP
ncbi:hypothetical protein ACFVFS_05515 [Kitasatospora sp. NPDC057692]|uniref:hypothetical protein n=1 Tax=Kitasatospora sp. NPDC057692 TaxID=3346215 RepID=UPI003679D6F1